MKNIKALQIQLKKDLDALEKAVASKQCSLGFALAKAAALGIEYREQTAALT